jgi:hypothetical protein
MMRGVREREREEEKRRRRGAEEEEKRSRRGEEEQTLSLSEQKRRRGGAAQRRKRASGWKERGKEREQGARAGGSREPAMRRARRDSAPRLAGGDVASGGRGTWLRGRGAGGDQLDAVGPPLELRVGRVGQGGVALGGEEGLLAQLRVEAAREAHPLQHPPAPVPVMAYQSWRGPSRPRLGRESRPAGVPIARAAAPGDRTGALRVDTRVVLTHACDLTHTPVEDHC